jgi:hypothetical protein
MKTLSEYIASEFGIVPDEVQLEQIRRLVNKEMVGKITTAGDIAFLARTQDKRQHAPFYELFVDLPHMGFRLIKTETKIF